MDLHNIDNEQDLFLKWMAQDRFNMHEWRPMPNGTAEFRRKSANAHAEWHKVDKADMDYYKVEFMGELRRGWHPR